MSNKRNKKKRNSKGIDGFVDEGEEEYFRKKKYVRGEEINKLVGDTK